MVEKRQAHVCSLSWYLFIFMTICIWKHLSILGMHGDVSLSCPVEHMIHIHVHVKLDHLIETEREIRRSLRLVLTNLLSFCRVALIILILVIVYVVLAFVCHGLTLPTCLQWGLKWSGIWIVFFFLVCFPLLYGYVGFCSLSFLCCCNENWEAIFVCMLVLMSRMEIQTSSYCMTWWV